jgi:hypothetical protein
VRISIAIKLTAIDAQINNPAVTRVVFDGNGATQYVHCMHIYGIREIRVSFSFLLFSLSALILRWTYIHSLLIRELTLVVCAPVGAPSLLGLASYLFAVKPTIPLDHGWWNQQASLMPV